MALRFDERVRNLIDGTSFAVLATLMPDGSPQTSVIWVGRDEDVLIFTTHDLRLKARNLRRDPRASSPCSRSTTRMTPSTSAARSNSFPIRNAGCPSSSPASTPARIHRPTRPAPRA